MGNRKRRAKGGVERGGGRGGISLLSYQKAGDTILYNVLTRVPFS